MKWLIITGCLLLGTVAVSAKKGSGTLPAGTWGGEHVLLEVSSKGAELEFDCARGEIPSPIKLDSRRRFDVRGTFSPEHGGPVLRDEKTPMAQARYSGHISGDVMSLTVTSGTEKQGPFTLVRGQQPKLRKCR